ncbi:ABC transporter permease [Stenotrophomonas mori]|uniref:FtsX-like permease family protein n=1 Tax=Stenotrophomonas mori TaxID=2871096 RepID=A0ABT0SIV9_9GAMM|nr:FtsX-like permease family protein [Stenotrophomonas mori]MCL7715260.1 FtsX-like permease family protein [Stenotrophomonas mori]
MLPLLAALRRAPLMPNLIVLQVAVACAILCNTLFLLGQQAGPLLVDDGLARDQLVIVDQLVSRGAPWTPERIRAGRDALAAIPGVRNASAVTGAPMRQTLTMTYELKAANGTLLVASGYMGEGLLDTFGLRLSRGRDFLATEYRDIDMQDDLHLPIIITEALARALFDGADPIGAMLRPGDGAGSYTVVGVVEHLMRYQLSELDDGKAEYAVLLPGQLTGMPLASYVLRTDPQRRDAVRTQIPDILERTFAGQLVPGIKPVVADYEQLRSEGLRTRRAAVWLLATVNTVIAAITLVGIASLSGYWIQQRTRQIGIRRALGATRHQILRHFLLENLLLVGAGLLLGLLLAVAINQWLMRHYELARLPLYYPPLAAGALLLLGQLAVAAPARRAARLAPASATRSV